MSAVTLSGHAGALETARQIGATLSQSCRFSADPAGVDILLVDGNGDWPSAVTAALEHGAGTIVVLDPGIVGASAVSELSETLAASKTAIVLSESAAGNPALAPWVAAWQGQPTAIALHGSGRERRDTKIFAQLRVLRAIGVSLEKVIDHQGVDGAGLLTAMARFADEPVVVRAATHHSNVGQPSQKVDAFFAAGLARLTLPMASDARCAAASVTSANGELTLPSIFEHAHRAAVRVLAGGTQSLPSDPLGGFAKDLLTLEELMS